MRGVAARATIAIGAAAMLASPLSQAIARDTPQATDAIATALIEMRERDQLLTDIGWKLATANAPYCADTSPAIGLMLFDTGSFSDPALIRKTLGGDHDIWVQAVGKDSPAAKAGLRAKMPLLWLGGESTSFSDDERESNWQWLTYMNGVMDETLAEKGDVGIIWKNYIGASDYQEITGTPACILRMEQRDGEDRARADGKRILIGSEFPGFSYAEDELASAIAHEMAHIVLGHSAWLDEQGRKRNNVRETEREADRLAPWLLANAGYDPMAAVRFMRRWGPDHSGGLLRNRTHDGWDERTKMIATEAALVAEALNRDGAADWRTNFARQIEVPEAI